MDEMGTTSDDADAPIGVLDSDRHPAHFYLRSSAFIHGSHPQTELLFPLSEFYARSGRELPQVADVAEDEVPEPYQQLLVHARDMTPTLEAFHGERIHLRLLERRLEGESLWRQVVLTLNGSARPVEFGAIVIYAHRFPPAAREAILGCRRPLGTILADYRVEHRSCPRAFLRVAPDSLINEALSISGEQALYGRRNVLLTPDGEALAEILEILPPAEAE
jgi:chorismate-pyruvate lyase